MGNRAVITTQNDIDSGGIGVYLHWNGGYDSVRPLLDYCRLRSFRPPDEDSYGYARMIQVMANFLGGDGLSIGVGPLNRLDTDNWDNGTYVLKGWDISSRLYFKGEEQKENGYDDFIGYLDGCQPESQKVGQEMLFDLRFHGRTLDEAASQYHYSMRMMDSRGISPKGFVPGRSYPLYPHAESGKVKVIGKEGRWLIASVDGRDEERLPLFRWINGCESAIVPDRNGAGHPITSVSWAGKLRSADPGGTPQKV